MLFIERLIRFDGENQDRVAHSIVSLKKPLVGDYIHKIARAYIFCQKYLRIFCAAETFHIFFGTNGGSFAYEIYLKF